MWDGELIELLLAALAEPHAPESVLRREIEVAHGSCRCGTVRYEIDGPFDVMAHCHAPSAACSRALPLPPMSPCPRDGSAGSRGRSRLRTTRPPQTSPRARPSAVTAAHRRPRWTPVAALANCPAENLQRDLGSDPRATFSSGPKPTAFRSAHRAARGRCSRCGGRRLHADQLDFELQQ